MKAPPLWTYTRGRMVSAAIVVYSSGSLTLLVGVNVLFHSATLIGSGATTSASLGTSVTVARLSVSEPRLLMSAVMVSLLPLTLTLSQLWLELALAPL